MSATTNPTATAQEPVAASTKARTKRNPRKMVRVINSKNKVELPGLVPETHLDLFPDLREVTPAKNNRKEA